MKALIASLLLTCAALPVWTATTINEVNHYAFDANAGWMDWRNNTNNGAVIAEYVCSGYLYSANLGWIRLGNGTPTNGIQYQNLSANDYGVNLVSQNRLRGYAYGANIGWISFEDEGNPQVDLNTGDLSGYAYSANTGWISLSNEFSRVQTDIIANGADTDGDGMADAWERNYFGGLGAGAGADPDGDGMNNLQEFLAGTSPTDALDRLVITSYAIAPGGTAATVGWQSVLTRRYRIEKTLNLNSPAWIDSGLGLIVPSGMTTTATFGDSNAPMRFYRVRAIRPLAP